MTPKAKSDMTFEELNQKLKEAEAKIQEYEAALHRIGTYHSHDGGLQAIFEIAREVLEKWRVK